MVCDYLAHQAVRILPRGHLGITVVEAVRRPQGPGQLVYELFVNLWPDRLRSISGGNPERCFEERVPVWWQGPGGISNLSAHLVTIPLTGAALVRARQRLARPRLIWKQPAPYTLSGKLLV